MKHFRKIELVIMLLLTMVPVSVNAGGLGNAHLSYIEGDLQIRSEDSSEWFPASINMPLRDGDSIWVPDGARAELQLAGGTQVRLDERSSLDLLNINRDSSQFYLAEGSAHINFRGGRSGGLIQIDTPIASVRAYDRGAFNIDVAGNGETDVSAYRGLVHAESRSGRTRVSAGDVLRIGVDYADLAPLGRPDEWERWNTERDRRAAENRYSSRYLPDELETYAGDFDDNGRWVSVEEYGYVWTPTVQVSVGWSPFRNGRWSWIGGDYVWVGYEPWGWAPYHYGRWDYSAAVGWFWVPPARGDVYWGPGYVGWVRTPTYVAWVPLAPREIYYGYGNYGLHSVNLVTVNINAIVIKHKYRNVRVNNAVTTMHHDTFVRGRHADFKVRENPFLSEKISIGRPDIRPERESKMAVIRDIPRAKEPPMKIREIKTRQIRESRPIIREREKSVFSPNMPDKQMRVQTVEVPRERKRGIPDERDGRQQHQGMTEKERESGTNNKAPIFQPFQKIQRRQPEQQIQQPERPKQEVLPPERMKSREIRRPEEGVPNQQMPKQREAAPVLNRQIQQPERPKQEVLPPERMKSREIRRPEEGVPNQQMPKQREAAPVLNRQIQQPERPKQEVLPPERMKSREIRRPEEGVPNQQMPKQREAAPVLNRQIQPEDRQQKQQTIPLNRQNMPPGKEEKKVRQEKDGAQPSGEGQQRPVSSGAPSLR